MAKLEFQRILQTIILNLASSAMEPILTIKKPEASPRPFSTYSSQSIVITGWGVTEGRSANIFSYRFIFLIFQKFFL